MKELSLHILDIVQNSVKAESSLIKIDIIENTLKDILEFSITDNGKGMPQDFLKNVLNPFTTTRTTRKVGLGLPLLKSAANLCEGDIDIKSELGKGTTVKAWFVHSHIDRAPLGDMAGTMITLVVSNPSIDFVYKHKFNDLNEFIFDTREIKKRIEGVEINSIEVVSWMQDFLTENINELYGGVSN